MIETNLEDLLAAMHRRDTAGLNNQMSDTVVLRGPILLQPFEGKAAVGQAGLHGLSKAWPDSSGRRASPPTPWRPVPSLCRATGDRDSR